MAFSCWWRLNEVWLTFFPLPIAPRMTRSETSEFLVVFTWNITTRSKQIRNVYHVPDIVSNYFTCVQWTNPPKQLSVVATIFISILKMKKLRHEDIKSHVQVTCDWPSGIWSRQLASRDCAFPHHTPWHLRRTGVSQIAGLHNLGIQEPVYRTVCTFQPCNKVKIITKQICTKLLDKTLLPLQRDGWLKMNESIQILLFYS